MNTSRGTRLSFSFMIFLFLTCPSSGQAGPLHDAAMTGDTEQATRLIIQGANINAKDDMGFTPLQWAALRGHEDMVEMLVDHGADVDVKGIFGWGALELAVSQGHDRIAETLREHGAKGDEALLKTLAKTEQERERELEENLESIRESERRLSPASLFYLGKAAYEMGDYAGALRSLQPSANSGHADAEYYIGIMYVNGRGVPQDEAMGASWYQRAAEQGHADAQYYLGVLYSKGDGVPQDDENGVKWWQRAANQGQIDAQYSIGHLYFRGWMGVSQDNIAAYLWISLAADAGQRQAVAVKQILEIVLTERDLATARNLKATWEPKKEREIGIRDVWETRSSSGHSATNRLDVATQS